ncbi:MAG: hypothetical protein HQ559_17770 [Lentisphaerae bacterium]|nr:hypothetical protein [Lentisphaerota bacterium]
MSSKVIGGAVACAIILGLVGLVAGYFLYAKLAGEYVGLETLIAPKKGALESAVHSIVGIDSMRTKILWSGGAGAVIGLVVGALLPAFKR